MIIKIHLVAILQILITTHPNKPMLVKPDEISSINSTIDATDKIGAK
jgi:hypothetical protein